MNLIPRYNQFAKTTNAFNFQYRQEHAPIAVDATPTYDALRRFLARARQEGVKVCFVAFRPRPDTADSPAYALDPEVLGMIATRACSTSTFATWLNFRARCTRTPFI